MTTTDVVRTQRDVLLAIRSGALPPPPAGAFLGLRIEEVEPGAAVFGWTPQQQHLNATGTVNGGLLATLADFALCCAVNDVPADAPVVTQNLTMNYLRPITLETGPLHARARVLHQGRRSATTEASIVDDGGRLHVHATATVALAGRG
ncbi:uncharacterized domain 1-containing protein [Pseudonocardia thermophila]|jgi:uncharacterized domain 1|uniref:Uncharacterized domain 1-containing protein n=1 Tax=Pseudonocardia thermophila TaxID=1848 RepID=A0A1M6WXT3_PSETH|nr:PaaI family thioesterase [Pseudonocardia thermophila]SHK98365.1 uncharacterized domain 1-containing protein [Pseudonocardia thermophila]